MTAVQTNERTISDITEEIQGYSNEISTMRSNVENKIGDLIDEINKLNQLLRENRNRMEGKLEETSSKNKSN